VRSIHIPRLDEVSLGELLMHFMLETVIAARLLGVDPFDQPPSRRARCWPSGIWRATGDRWLSAAHDVSPIAGDNRTA
jgi:hypothetical protein